jgi:uncharacterized RDD family membrane protein YckC
MTSADTCPKCHGREFDSAGNCVSCGSQPHDAPAANPAPKQASGLIEVDYSEAHPEAPTELPQWRLELSRRLQEIKTRREALPSPAPPDPDGAPLPRPFPVEVVPAQAEEPTPAVALEQPVRKERSRVPRRIAKFPTVAVSTSPDSAPPVPAPLAELPLFKAAAETKPEAARKDQTPAAEIQDLIDRAVSRQVAPAQVAPLLPAAVAKAPGASDTESKLILLSRTLSGLVDMIIIGACTAGFMIAADAFSGIEVLDPTSLISYGVLLAAVYIAYSLFFLMTSNQTIGMMITDLRLLDSGRTRPVFLSVLARTLFYPCAVLFFGIGLVWGFFDRRARCLHDILSGTRVTRVPDL